MKSVEDIKKVRNALKTHIFALRLEMKTIRENKKWDEISESEKKKYMYLKALIEKFESQIIGINFCLNEDDELDDGSHFIHKYNLGEEFIFKY